MRLPDVDGRDVLTKTRGICLEDVLSAFEQPCKKEITMTTQGYIRYRSDYKYQLAEEYEISIKIKPKSDIETGFIDLGTDGKLTIKNGYAWDGPSGPVKDTDENMRASLVHDALYQLMRNDKLKSRTHRKAADQEFQNICKADGVSNFRASVYYKALRKFGKPAASTQNKREVVRAPVG